MAVAYANRAEALMALRRYTDAVDDYSSAIEFGAATAQTYLGRAAAYTSLNKPWKGYADLARARERDAALAPAAAEQTGSLPASAKTSSAAESPCEGTGRLGDGSLSFARVADTRHPAPPNSLLLRASNEVSIGNAEPEDPADGDGVPCDSDDTQAIDPPSPAAAEPSAGRPVGTELEGWTVALTEAGQYVATNSDYPKLRLGLEMYGEGEPELLNWQVLKGTLRGIGLLHYYAGASPEGGASGIHRRRRSLGEEADRDRTWPLGRAAGAMDLERSRRRGGGPARGTEPGRGARRGPNAGRDL